MKIMSNATGSRLRSDLLSAQNSELRTETGFTLAELAIVLIVITLLVAGLLVPLTAQIQLRQISDTQKTLEQAREALIGFAISQGRLPCPAAPGTNGKENPINGGDCPNALNGFLPAITLGITPTDNQGYLMDAWGNRIRYAVDKTTINDPLGIPINSPFTSTNGMKTVTMANIVKPSSGSFLNICSSSTGITANDCGVNPGTTTIADKIPAVIYSLGKNGATATTMADELANTDGDRIFVSHETTTDPVTKREFDDLVVWVSLNTLFNRMVTAGQLP